MPIAPEKLQAIIPGAWANGTARQQLAGLERALPEKEAGIVYYENGGFSVPSKQIRLSRLQDLLAGMKSRGATAAAIAPVESDIRIVQGGGYTAAETSRRDYQLKTERESVALIKEYIGILRMEIELGIPAMIPGPSAYEIEIQGALIDAFGGDWPDTNQKQLEQLRAKITIQQNSIAAWTGAIGKGDAAADIGLENGIARGEAKITDYRIFEAAILSGTLPGGFAPTAALQKTAPAPGGVEADLFGQKAKRQAAEAERIARTEEMKELQGLVPEILFPVPNVRPAPAVDPGVILGQQPEASLLPDDGPLVMALPAPNQGGGASLEADAASGGTLTDASKPKQNYRLAFVAGTIFVLGMSIFQAAGGR